MTKKISFVVFAFLAIGIGLYPLLYVIIDTTFGLLDSKSPELLNSTLWNVAFYTHIFLGGIALLTGWSQFSGKIRRKNLLLHRRLGMIYCICVLFSGSASLYIGYYATGGLVPAGGFIGLGLVWLTSTGLAFNAIMDKKILIHQKWMIVSFAACFAAVMLRIWLPILTAAFGDFLPAYKMVAWLCWVPNMIFAYFVLKKKGLLAIPDPGS